MKYKLRITFIVILSLITFTALYAVISKARLSSVKAVGNLSITHNGTSIEGNPVFNADDMKPCDIKTEIIKVKNNDELARYIAVKGIKTNETKDISETLFIEIKTGSNVIYAGSNSLKDFFSDSGSENGIPLSPVNPEGEVEYIITVHFPCDAGNKYQLATLLFDLKFGIITGDNLVINEVYYNVDSENGIDGCCGEVNAVISGNAAGTKNIINIKINNTCLIVQSNVANIVNNVISKVSTGKNSSVQERVKSGNASSNISINNLLNFNFGSCASQNARSDEWLEIYNPGESQVSLKNWKLIDNSGEETIIHPNIKLNPGEFALIAKDAQTWQYWNEEPHAKKINLGVNIGNGLDNEGDHLILLDPDGVQRDFVAWGDDTYLWDPSVPNADKGNSIERLSSGFDTDSPSDWLEKDPPTPGN